MMKRVSLVSLLVLCSISALSQNVDSYRAEYEKFRKQAFGTYSDFRDECNQKYCEFLKSAWEYYKAGPIAENPFKDDNKPPVIYEEDGKDKQDIPMPYDDIVPAPTPEPQPKPISPIPPTPDNDQLEITINFFNTALAIRAPQSIIKLSSCNGEDLAKAWKTMSGSAYNPLLTDCLEVRSLMGLCDWGYLLFIWHLSSTYLGENTNEATLLTAYIYSQSGYKMRLGEAEGHLCMLFASKHMIYGAPCYEIGQEYFYPLNYYGDGLNACDFAFDNEESMSLYITNEQKFTLLVGESRKLKAEGYPTSVNIAINESLVAFYSTYPTSEADNNFMTRWAMYANTPLDSEVKKQLYPALYSQLEGKTYPEAANILLDFVQSAFVYEYDDKVWGGDRAFFAEESLYYPYCDCEDRSILFSRLVRDLLGLKVILVYYPGHLATAVRFDDYVRGDYINLNGERYLVCDPTYIGAPIGVTMPDMDNTTATVILLE